MILSGSSDTAPGAPIRIRQDDKLYCRQQSRGSTSAAGAATPSFQVYYGVASGAVPFVWESQPGTPKHPCSSAVAAAAAATADDLPPLTPPPSYQSSPLGAASPRKASQGPNLIKAIVPRLSRRKGRGATPPQASPSSSLRSPASYFSPVGSPHRQDRLRRVSNARSPFSPVAGDEGPAPCFTLRHGSHLTGCGKMVKKALLSIVGHGSRRIVSTP